MTVITLGGVEYPAVEPSNARARTIRKIITEYAKASAEAKGDAEQQMELLENMMDGCLKMFSPEIEADWARIAETATDRERLAAIAVVKEAVVVAFQTLAVAATPAANREARRKKK